MANRNVMVLGAGASRGVSYEHETPIPSPLDRDYFDLLQRFDHFEKDDDVINRVVQWVQELPFEYWRSMEQSFYTLQSRAHLAHKLRAGADLPSDADIVTSFVNATGALLRAAHGRNTCNHHKRLIKNLGTSDTILTFNYDLVTERAMKAIPEIATSPFGPWVYGLEPANKPESWTAPTLLKLHGSFSWDYPMSAGKPFAVRLENWEDLEESPGFRRFGSVGTEFPIFLPFWDKRIEVQPWLDIWRKAYNRLTKCTGLLIWGYSLPKTDLKAYQLFTLARRNNINICVVDPSSETKDRWRRLFVGSKFWEYSKIEEFLAAPPPWWEEA
jgi:hypothetical protein